MKTDTLRGTTRGSLVAAPGSAGACPSTTRSGLEQRTEASAAGKQSARWAALGTRLHKAAELIVGPPRAQSVGSCPRRTESWILQTANAMTRERELSESSTSQITHRAALAPPTCRVSRTPSNSVPFVLQSTRVTVPELAFQFKRQCSALTESPLHTTWQRTDRPMLATDSLNR
jgi:hypothetical protein